MSLRRLFYPALFLVCLAFALAGLRTYGLALNVDASAFLIVGRGWIGGLSPYSGLWDHKPPAVYEIAALASFLDRHGDGVLACQMVSALSIALTSVLTGKIIDRLAGSRVAGVAGAIAVSVLMAWPPLSWGGGLSEFFAMPGVALALLILLTTPTLSKRLTLIAGGALGWAASCSLLSLGVMPVLAYVWLSERGDGPPVFKGWRSRLQPSKLALSGCGAGLVVVLCWLPVLASGSLISGLQAVFGYSELYRSLAIFDPVTWVIWLAILSPLWLPAVIMAVLIRNHDRGSFMTVPLLWLAGDLGWLLYGQRIFTHYLLILVVPVVVLILAGLWRTRSLKLPRNQQLVGALYSTLVVASTVALMIGLVMPSPMPETNNDRVVADYIDKGSLASDHIYVWGTDSEIYLQADRMPAGTYFYSLPLMTPGFGETAAVEMLKAWQADPPRFVVDASFETVNHGGMAPLLVPHLIDTGDKRILSTNLDSLREFVRTHYELVATLGDKRIYRLQ